MNTHTHTHIQDSIGRSALHISITCKQPSCSDILLAHPDLDLATRDKNGHTPFAAAMAVKDNKAGLAILTREPNAAEQVGVCVCAYRSTGACMHVCIH